MNWQYPSAGPRAGKLIVIDGFGGNFKTTQCALLAVKLDQIGLNYEVIRLPRYDAQPYGPFIRRYLEGEFGPADQFNPYFASLPYAEDRRGLRRHIRRALKAGRWLIFDRYIHSSIAYQGAKLEGEKREEFIGWLIELEFKHFGLEPEDLGILLDMPVELSLSFAEERGAGEGPDSHKQDFNFSCEIASLYRQMAESLPHWQIINCVTCNGKVLSPEEIHQRVWELIKVVI